MRRFPLVLGLLAVTLGRAGAVRAQDSTAGGAATTGTAGSPAARQELSADTKDPNDPKQRADKPDPFRLTTDEIDASRLPNAYELVDRLRRPWLRKDALTGAPVALYMDEQNIGGAEKLRDIPAADIAELQYLPNEQAVQRWGATAVQGSVIVVIRRR
jgi:hypothetical protein